MLHKQGVWDIARKQYQARTHQQHHIIHKTITRYLSDISQQQARLLALYVQPILGNQLDSTQYSPYSFIIDLAQQTISTTPSKSSSQCLIIDYNHYLTSQALSNTTIQQEIQFLSSSQYLCSIPKSIYYQILKQCMVRTFTHNKIIYEEQQRVLNSIHGASIFIVRQGQFGYSKFRQKSNRHVDAVTFRAGQCFGGMDFEKQTRKFRAYCKTTQGKLYIIPKAFFDAHLKKYTNAIAKKFTKLNKYLPTKINHHINPQKQNPSSLSSYQQQQFNKSFQETTMYATFNKTHSLLLPTLSLAKTKNSQLLEHEFSKNTTYLSLHKGPFNNYPLTRQRAHFTQSQFRQTSYLIKSEFPKKSINKCLINPNQLNSQFQSLNTKLNANFN